MTKVFVNKVTYAFKVAAERNGLTIEALEWLRKEYVESDLPDRKARIRALDAKIDALRAIKMDGDSYPWSLDTL